jgi:hypothetical protein
VEEELFLGALSSRSLTPPASKSPRWRYHCAVHVIGTYASEVKEPIASALASDFSKTFESPSLIIGEGVSGKESMSGRIFEWNQVIVTSIPVVILPERIRSSYISSVGHVFWRVMEKIKAQTKARGTTEIASGFEKIASAACIEFCNSHGLIPDLRNCLDRAKLAFSNRQSLSAEYDRFDQDEYEEDGHVVIRIEVNSDQETAFKEYDAFTDWMLDNITDDNLDSFVVRVSLI